MNLGTASKWVLVLLLAFAGGCAVGPNYKKPTVDAPASFRFATNQSATSLGDLPWWEAFKDPNLHVLIREALTNSYNIKQAAARVEQARNQALVAQGSLFPQIDYNGAISRGRNTLLNSPIGALQEGTTRTSADLFFSATWEIDFWGRLRRLNESARAQYFATDEARHGVMITLLSDVATAYFQLLQLDQELEILRSATNAYAHTYRIFNDRRANGVASKLETDRAAAALANAAATIPRLRSQIAITENQINTLLGRNPGPVRRRSIADQAHATPTIPPGLPSDLLRRRPDIRQSEQLLISANAEIGASLADFFPRIGLTALVGRISPELSGFTSGAANAWNAGANLVGPIFRGGQLRAQYRASKARFEEAKANYQQTVITAFQEVSDALITRTELDEALTFNQQEVAALAESVDLATQRYLNGKSSYFEVLQAQQELYPAQRVEVQTRVGQVLANIRLYRALGGGWQPELAKK